MCDSNEHVWYLTSIIRGAYLQARPRDKITHDPDTSYLDIGDVVEINKPERRDLSGRIVEREDPNHGREGPLVGVPEGDSGPADAKPWKVWFEDGVESYQGEDLKPTGCHQDVADLPKEMISKLGQVNEVPEVVYSYPYRIHAKNF